jgi:hypothetical protein
MTCNSLSHCEALPVFVLIFVGFALFTGLILKIVLTVIYCKIFSKAGYSWALGLLTLIPLLRLIMLCVLGFGDWPNLKKLRELTANKQQT